MGTQQKERYPEFMLSMHPAVGRDAVWTHDHGDLTLLTFDAKGAHRKSFPIPGTEIGTNFVINKNNDDERVVLYEGRGLSLLDLKAKRDLLAFVPETSYWAGSPNQWAYYNPSTKSVLACMRHFIGEDGDIPADIDVRTEIVRLSCPPEAKLPKDPDDFFGLKSIDHTLFDAGPRSHAFLGPKVILIRQPKHDSIKVFDKTTEKWLAIDFDLKPTLHPLLDSLNAYRDSLPALEKLSLAEAAPFAIMAHATPTSRSQLILASWKDKVRFTPVLLNGAPFGDVDILLLAPDGKHFLVGDAHETLYLGTVLDTDLGYAADLKEVQKFSSSYRLSWMGSSRGFVAGVWDEDETDLFIHWL